MKKQIPTLLFTAVAAISFLFYPQISSVAVQGGIYTCTTALIPSLFPYFIITNLCLSQGILQRLSKKTGKYIMAIFHLSGEASAALLVGTLSGFPVGGQTAIKLYDTQQITKKEAEHLLMFCSNAGPAFIIGVIGSGLFQDSAIGLYLWLIHLLGALLIGIIFRKKLPKQEMAERKRTERPPSVFHSFSVSVIDAGYATLRVCMFVVFFSILCAHLHHILPANWTTNGYFAVLLGSLELSNGVTMLKNFSPAASFIAISALLAWNGVCVHCQVLSAIGEKHLSTKHYFIGKLLHIFISIILAGLVASLFPFRSS